jgi:hypothetical protein
VIAELERNKQNVVAFYDLMFNDPEVPPGKLHAPLLALV